MIILRLFSLWYKYKAKQTKCKLEEYEPFFVDYLYSNVPPTFGIVEKRNRMVSSPYQYFEIFRHNIKGEGHKKKFNCTGKNK
jgi:hypothetical protein